MQLYHAWRAIDCGEIEEDVHEGRELDSSPTFGDRYCADEQRLDSLAMQANPFNWPGNLRLVLTPHMTRAINFSGRSGIRENDLAKTTSYLIQVLEIRVVNLQRLRTNIVPASWLVAPQSSWLQMNEQSLIVKADSQIARLQELVHRKGCIVGLNDCFRDLMNVDELENEWKPTHLLLELAKLRTLPSSCPDILLWVCPSSDSQDQHQFRHLENARTGNLATHHSFQLVFGWFPAHNDTCCQKFDIR